MAYGAYSTRKDSGRQVRKVKTDRYNSHTDKLLSTDQQTIKARTDKPEGAFWKQQLTIRKPLTHHRDTKKLRAEMLLHSRPQALYCRQDRHRLLGAQCEALECYHCQILIG